MSKGWKGNSKKHSMAKRGIKVSDITKQGLSVKKHIEEKDVDPKELKMGIEVEMEHTDNPELAKKIALDHLAEHKYYYTWLKKYEPKFSKKPESGLLDDFFGGL